MPVQQEHNKSASKVDKRDSINVQQYHSQAFKQPQELESQSQQSIVEEFVSNSVDNTNNKSTSSNTFNNMNHNNNTQNNSNPLPSSTNPAKKPSQPRKSSLQQTQQQQQKIRNQLILQFKISQLQKICSTLTSANQKLLDKIQQLQQQNDLFKNRITILEQQKEKQQSIYQQSREDDDQFVESLNNDSNQQSQVEVKFEEQMEDDGLQQFKLEEEVVDIQKLIKEYREELNKAEQLNKTIKQSYSKNINSLQQQLIETKQKLNSTQEVNNQLEQQLIELQQKNQSLETQIQSIINSQNDNERYYEDPTSRNRTQSRSSQYQTPVHQRHPYAKNMRSYYEDQYSQQINPFDSSVQVQLQKLIQKLVKQLQYQRTIKKRMTQQMKRIQKDLLQSEKQIMLKNKKIYELQMNLLKGQKNHVFNNGNGLSNSQLNEARKDQKHKYSIFSPGRDDHNSRGNYNSPKVKDISPKIKEKYLQHQKQRINTSAITYSPSNRPSPISQNYNKSKQFVSSRNPNISQSPSSSQGKLLQTFSLLQLLNEPTITLTIKQKLHICLKLVTFYEQKIYQYKNYNLLMLENVLVTNFNRINLRLIKIRVEEHKKGLDESNLRMRRNSKDEVADGPQKVIWNLGFLLNSLLIDVPSKQQNLGQSDAQRNVLQLIDNILDNRNLNKETFQHLKEHMEVALEQRTS